MGLFRGISNAIEKVESLLAAIALLFMISLAFLQILLRNIWHTGIEWGDPVVRALVLWVGFLGASIATHQGGHIRFDVVSKFLPKKINSITRFIVHLASALVCALLAHAAYDFLLMEKEFDTMLTGEIPNWIAVIIIPISFLIIGFRMLLHAADDIILMFKPKPTEAD